MNAVIDESKNELPATAAQSSFVDKLGLAAFVAVVIAIWSVIGRYWGIQHDAMGYMLQSAAVLQPDPLANDLFLRFRSQEEFTIFPQVCAYVISWIGVDRAGALLTFVFLTAWVVTAWFLVRFLLGPSLAWLSVGLLLAIPGWYGAGEVFRYAEPFMTARACAEALSLGAILAILRSRLIVSVVLLMLAAVIHPLMALPAGIAVVALALPLSSVRHWMLFTLVIIAGAVVGSFILMQPDPLMYGEWLRTTRWRSGFLFVGEWGARDREVAAQTLLTLAVAAAVVPRSRARDVAVATIVVGASGLFLAALASELLPLKLLLQGQPWRWMWIGRFAATALLPIIVISAWRTGTIGRSAAIFLVCAWLLTDAGSFRDIEPAGLGGLLCALSLLIWHFRNRISSPSARIALALSWGAFALVCLSFLSIIAVAANNGFSFGRDPVWVQRVTDLLSVPGIAVIVIVAAWYSSFVLKRRLVSGAAVAASVAFVVAALPETTHSWSRTPFDEQSRASFAEWRRMIPRDSEVLWFEEPQAAWFLLDRKSYLTVSQAAGTVFSEEATSEILRRADSLSALAAPGVWVLDPATRLERTRDLTPEILASICRESSVGFVVSRDRIDNAVASAEWPGKADFVYLYDCSSYRDGGVK